MGSVDEKPEVQAEEQFAVSHEGKKAPAHKKEPSSGEASPRKQIIGIVAAALVIIVIIACCFIGMNRPAEVEPVEEAVTEEVEQPEVPEPTETLPQSPIDWAEYQGINDNIYAWIRMPDTEVDQPIVQHPIGENYYLQHDIYGNDTIEGAIYSQKTYNSKDLQADPVTVLYGHTFQDHDTMFSTLHNLEDPVFFEEHPYFYIYTPEYNLTYEIVSAYEWSNKLILAKFDMGNPQVLQEYFDSVADPDTVNPDNVNVRERDRLIAGEDHIVILSTCTKPSDANRRYLVTGALISAEPVASEGSVLSEADEAIYAESA